MDFFKEAIKTLKALVAAFHGDGGRDAWRVIGTSRIKPCTGSTFSANAFCPTA